MTYSFPAPGYVFRRHSDGALAVRIAEATALYEQVRLPEPLEVRHLSYDLHMVGNALVVKGSTYADVKRWVVRLRYGPDEQIAIMLNATDSRRRAEYDEMMAWRAFAAKVAAAVTQVHATSVDVITDNTEKP